MNFNTDHNELLKSLGLSNPLEGIDLAALGIPVSTGQKPKTEIADQLASLIPGGDKNNGKGVAGIPDLSALTGFNLAGFNNNLLNTSDLLN